MASIYREALLDVPVAVAWDFVDRYSRSEVHAFSICISERQVDDYRVVQTRDGDEIWERNVTVDPVRRRAVYTIPQYPGGAQHHQAEMHVDEAPDGQARLEWTTDILPHELVDGLDEAYDEAMADLVAAINAHAVASKSAES